MKIFSLSVLLVMSLVMNTAKAELITAADIAPEDPYYGLPGNSRVHGWSFTTTEPIEVTHLGWFDGRGRGTDRPPEHGWVGDGLGGSHSVAIWTTDGTKIISTSVRNIDKYNDKFRYRDVSPTFLAADQTYVIAGLSMSEWTTRDAMAGSSLAVPLDFTVDPVITFGSGREKIVSQLEFPENTNSELWFGPNFRFLIVPEPAVFISLMIGLFSFVLIQYSVRN